MQHIVTPVMATTAGLVDTDKHTSEALCGYVQGLTS